MYYIPTYILLAHENELIKWLLKKKILSDKIFLDDSIKQRHVYLQSDSEILLNGL